MGRYSEHVVYSLLATLAGLPIGCLLGGVGFGLFSYLSGPGPWETLSAALLLGGAVALVAVLVGVVPALLYGVPAYAFVSYRGRANSVTALGIGLFPGLITLPFSKDLAVFVLVFGPCVALVTHLVAKRRLAKLHGLGANNSSKPTPLRGAA
jgi:uncharacterized membrane protein